MVIFIFMTSLQDVYKRQERYSKGSEAVQALKAGQIDCVIIDSQPAQKFVENNDDPVSYTHLDVYKRQLQTRLKMYSRKESQRLKAVLRHLQ